MKIETKGRFRKSSIAILLLFIGVMVFLIVAAANASDIASIPDEGGGTIDRYPACEHDIFARAMCGLSGHG